MARTEANGHTADPERELPRISIVVPTRNEAPGIGGLLRSLAPLRDRGHEVIVVDGGSEDGTVAAAAGLADAVIEAPRGRARQMNAGAERARGEVLWFLHADSAVPEEADRLIGAALGRGEWGWFDVRLSGAHPALRVVEWMMNRRARLTRIATGDQGLFVRRRLFQALGGFADIPLMEDIELTRRLKRRGPPQPVAARLITSSRRWERDGIARTILLMWRLRLAYALGARPSRLAERYR